MTPIVINSVKPILLISPLSASSSSQFSSPSSSPLPRSIPSPSMILDDKPKSPATVGSLSPRPFNFTLKPLTSSLRNKLEAISNAVFPKAPTKLEIAQKLIENKGIPHSKESYRALFKDSDFNAAAFYEIAETYLRGYGGLEKNEQEAILYYQLAAEEGHLEAQYKLGLLYSKFDERRSILLLQTAAKRQHQGAKSMLGILHCIDDLDETEHELDHLQISLESSRESLTQLILAAKHGNEDAQSLVDKLESYLKNKTTIKMQVSALPS